MDTILYFAHSEKQTINFLEELSEQLHLYGIRCTINYRNMTAETENYKIYAVSSCDALIGALPGFRYYLNDASQEEFNQRARLKLLIDAKELKNYEELIELLSTPIL